MGRLAFHVCVWTALFAAFAGLSLASPAAASSAPSCLSASSADVSLEGLQARPDAWTCGTDIRLASAPVVWVRFDLDQTDTGKAPRYLSLRLMRIDTLGVTVLGGGREIASRTYSGNSVRQGRSGPYLVAQLPGYEGVADSVIVRIAGAQYPLSSAMMSLETAPDNADWPFARTLLVAMIFGLVLAPMIANLVLFPILRRSFMLYHAGMTSGMLMTLAVASGFLGSIVTIGPNRLLTVLEMGYVLIVCFGGFFAATFLEEGAISAGIRKALAGAGLFLLVVGGGIILQVQPFASLDRSIYLLCFFPMLFVSLTAMTQAVQRGSIWVRYQIIGWMPAIFAGIDMVATGFGLQPETRFGVTAPFLAMAFEVVVTATGVAHRLILLRRERDDARSEALVLEKLSARDPMTGLYNRRALEERIETLHQAGYDTFALLDLDHFKQVNDTFGHGIGDDVIRTAAKVIQSDTESIAVRLGGEEFMLVMRGQDAPERAEAMRQAITLRVAREVGGLDRLVTASMGLAVVPFSAVPNSGFEDIYALVDALLYDAKETGRNRTVSQKLRAFRKRTEDRRERRA